MAMPATLHLFPKGSRLRESDGVWRVCHSRNDLPLNANFSDAEVNKCFLGKNCVTSFDRRISKDGLVALLGCTDPGGAAWFADLLSLWRPAGQPSGSHGLRLAIRNGYLNFYRCGQSVARVSIRQGILQAEVHIKYVRPDASAQTYAVLKSTGLSCKGYNTLDGYKGIHTLKKWIEYAESHKSMSREKRFVDEVLEHNPGVIDLEMGLPAFAPRGQKRTAPRMDIVALEEIDDGHQVVFWEAKLMGDGRLRKRDPNVPPEVLKQLDDYRIWMKQPGHSEAVRRAYFNCCVLLLTLHKWALKINPKTGPLGGGIGMVVQGNSLKRVDPIPRLLIDDRGLSQSWKAHETKLGSTKTKYVRGDAASDFRLVLNS